MSAATTFARNVSDNVFGAADARGLSMSALSRQTGISRFRLMACRLGFRPLFVKEIAALSEAVDVPVTDLVLDGAPERWWQSAPNPQCTPWCDRDHPSDEFARHGGMTCERTVIDVEDLFTVYVQGSHTIEDDDARGPLGFDGPTIDVTVRTDVLTPDQAHTLASQVQAAVRICDRGW